MLPDSILLNIGRVFRPGVWVTFEKYGKIGRDSDCSRLVEAVEGDAFQLRP
jgi:hypothetical protein